MGGDGMNEALRRVRENADEIRRDIATIAAATLLTDERQQRESERLMKAIADGSAKVLEAQKRIKR